MQNFKLLMVKKQACMHLKTKLKRKETVAFIGFIISNTPDIKI